MKTISLKISDDMSMRLSRLARQGGMKKSEIVRRALQEYLSEKQPDGACSFFEMARDIAGSVNGPSDLSYNKDHFEEYGK